MIGSPAVSDQYQDDTGRSQPSEICVYQRERHLLAEVENPLPCSVLEKTPQLQMIHRRTRSTGDLLEEMWVFDGVDGIQVSVDQTSVYESKRFRSSLEIPLRPTYAAPNAGTLRSQRELNSIDVSWEIPLEPPCSSVCDQFCFFAARLYKIRTMIGSR